MIKKTTIVGVLLSAVIFTLGATSAFADSTGITTTKLNVRSGPSTTYRVIGSLDKNKSITVLNSSQGWNKVKLSNSKYGWVSSKYIKTQQSNNSNYTNSSSNNNLSSQAKKTITVQASAYNENGLTSTGQKPRWGTIAVDPRVIPYGTKVYIPAFDKVFIANDCGGAIKGNKIDIFMNSKSECYKWGRKNIQIQVLGK